jgi:hypothetical protein
MAMTRRPMKTKKNSFADLIRIVVFMGPVISEK